MRADPPLASIIIPLYRSSNTLGECLDALAAQTVEGYEIILVDSSGDERAREIARSHPRAAYLASTKRLLPQAARNFGAEKASGRLLVFTDPDIYPAPDWLEKLVRGYEREPAIVFGPIACHGRRWVDRGVHLVKFNICLPGGQPREVRLGWSGNALIPREAFDALGGWDTKHTQGDSVFSARARAAGWPLRFEPRPLVFHDHENVALGGLFRERLARGREFAGLEAAGELGAPAGGVWLALRKLVAMPFRVAGGLLRIERAAARAQMLDEYLATFPVVALGVTGWYLGMADGWRRRLLRPS